MDHFLLDHTGLWVLSMGLTLLFGLAEALVAFLIFILSADLAIFVVAKLFVILALAVLTFFNVLLNVDQFRGGYLNVPDLWLTGLVLTALVVSLLVIPLSQVTRWVLATPLLDGALLYIVYKIQARATEGG